MPHSVLCRFPMPHCRAAALPRSAFVIRALFFYFRYIPLSLQIFFVSLHHLLDGRYQSPDILLSFQIFLVFLQYKNIDYEQNCIFTWRRR